MSTPKIQSTQEVMSDSNEIADQEVKIQQARDSGADEIIFNEDGEAAAVYNMPATTFVNGEMVEFVEMEPLQINGDTVEVEFVEMEPLRFAAQIKGSNRFASKAPVSQGTRRVN